MVTPDAPSETPPLQSTALTAELITAGKLHISEVPAERITDGIIHLTARQDAKVKQLWAPNGGPDNGVMHCNTPDHGRAPLQPGTLVTMWSPRPGADYNVPTQHYIDAKRQLRDIQYDPYSGQPILPPEVAARRHTIGRQTAALGDALLAARRGAFDTITDTEMPAAPIRLRPGAIFGNIIEGEVTNHPLPPMPDHVPTRRDMAFDTLDQALLNAELRKENERAVIAAAEAIVLHAATEITRELPVINPTRSRAARRSERRGGLRSVADTVIALGSAVIDRVSRRTGTPPRHAAVGRHRTEVIQRRTPERTRTQSRSH